MLKEISFYADFGKRDGVTHKKKETEPSQNFSWNTKEEKNSHCVCVCALTLEEITALGCDFFQHNAYTHVRNDCFFLLLCSKKKCAKFFFFCCCRTISFSQNPHKK